MTETKKYDTILTERIGRVERITLNRPEKRNALSFTAMRELIDAVRTAAYDKGCHAIVLRGAGPSFCAGFDLNAMQEENPYGELPLTVEEDVDICVGIGENWRHILNCRIPVIAQVHGNCLGNGTGLALHCDMVIVADDAQIGFPPVRSMGGPPTHMWIYHAGPQWSKRILLTGDKISGKKAAEIGLALESVPADDLDDHVMALATRISNIGRDLLGHNKRIVNLGMELMGRSTMQTLAAIHDVLGHGAPEVEAFHEKVLAQGVKAAVAERDAPFGD